MTVVVTLAGAALMAGSTLADESDSPKLSDQRMASSPAGLMKVLSDVSFLDPEDYQAKFNAEKSTTIHPFGIDPVAQSADVQSDTRQAPTVLKDLVDVGGVRRTSGSLMNLTNVPAESVNYVKAMFDALKKHHAGRHAPATVHGGVPHRQDRRALRYTDAGAGCHWPLRGYTPRRCLRPGLGLFPAAHPAV
jgi:hypothetical protein